MAYLHKRTILVLLAVSCCITGYGQVGKWKAKLVDKKVSARDKVYYSDSLMQVYRRSDYDSAIFFARKMMAYAKPIRDTSSIDFALINLGSLQRLKGNTDSALYYYSTVLESYKKQKFDEGIATVYNNMATIYKTQSRYDLAIKNYYEANDLLKHSTRYNVRANLYSNFAGLYYKLENYEKALELWQVARDFYKKDKNDGFQVTHTYRGFGRVYLRRNKTDEALKAIQTALELDKQNKIDVFIPEDLLLLMEIYTMKKDITKAEKAKQMLLPYLSQIDVPLTKAIYYEFSGDVELLKNKPAPAIQLYDSSLFYLAMEDAPETRLQVLRKKMSARIKTGNTKGLELEWQEIKALEKTVSKLRQDRITQETDARYNLREKEVLIDALNGRNKAIHQVALKERELKQQSRQQNLFLWLGILVVCFFAVYILFTNRKLSTTKKELEKNIVQKDFLFRELNHRVKNNLHIVSSFLGIEMHGKPENVQAILRTCENRIHSLGLVHEMLYRSEKIESVELKPYFDKLCHSVLQTLGSQNSVIEVSVQEQIWISSEKAILVGLILNELLTNAIKYAAPKDQHLLIKVSAVLNQGILTIAISDNGTGLQEDFDPKKSGSMGMKLAYGLTDQVGGTLTHENVQPGTAFYLSLAHDQSA